MEKKKRTHEDFMQFLMEKKKKDGKLNKLGEWLLSGGDTGWRMEKKDMRYILR